MEEIITSCLCTDGKQPGQPNRAGELEQARLGASWSASEAEAAGPQEGQWRPWTEMQADGWQQNLVDVLFWWLQLFQGNEKAMSKE